MAFAYFLMAAGGLLTLTGFIAIAFARNELHSTAQNLIEDSDPETAQRPRGIAHLVDPVGGLPPASICRWSRRRAT